MSLGARNRANPAARADARLRDIRDPMTQPRLYLGIDVGTASARAALFDARGVRRGMGTAGFPIWRPEEDFVQQSSAAIWQACCDATRAAMKESGASPSDVVGIGFDATCSLVALDANDAPVSISPDGAPEQDVIVWMDHRAIEQTDRINATKHPVLRYVGGTMSPEMEPPKMLWLKEKLPASFAKTARFFDLPDFLVFRATGADVRSLCTTVCKWTYLGHEARWDDSFFQQVGLAELTKNDHRAIGASVRPMGERAGALTPRAAKELGLAEGIAVGVSIIDAHAGGLGLLGAGSEAPLTSDTLETRLALIGGTSSCHMGVSREPRFIDGIWGPYHSAMVPGLWLTEGGQSATGALIDHVIDTHARGAELHAEAKSKGTTVYALLNARLDALSTSVAFPAALTRELHVQPDFHGNRSPRADPTLRGMISGLRLTESVDSLALLYLATIQAIAHGTRHIVDTMNAAGYRIDTLVACGGDTKNPVFVREHADVTGCRVILPKEREAVLLGAAMLGAVASGDVTDVKVAMREMNQVDAVVSPGSADVRAFHAQKHQVFQRMHADQLAYRALMRA
jgi:FGGY-family pentulose kinase